MKIHRTCPVTGQLVHMVIEGLTLDMLDKWTDGMLIQEAMPHLSDNQREFIQTGMTPDMWDTVFPSEEE